jgi:hypothetical protein
VLKGAGLKAEVAISLTGLFVAVATLAYALGGTTGSFAAAALGIGVTFVLALAVFADSLALMTRVVVAAMAVSAGTLTILSAVNTVHRWQLDRTKAAITRVINESYAAELEWYEHPHKQLLPKLEQYFLPPSQGERLATIQAAVARLSRCHYKMGAQARGTTFVSDITINGASALAQTEQSLYGPSYALRNGKWFLRSVNPIVYDAQLYVLKKHGSHWYVQSTPQPQSTEGCGT